MKKKLYIDELESFVAESADDVRMYPSDKVWRQIDRQLHSKKNWPALNFAAFLTGIGMLAALWFFQPDKDLFVITPAEVRTDAPAKSAALSNFSVADSPLSTIARIEIENTEENNPMPGAEEPFNQEADAGISKGQPAITFSSLNSANVPVLAAAANKHAAEEIVQTALVDEFVPGRLIEPLQSTALAKQILLTETLQPSSLFAAPEETPSRLLGVAAPQYPTENIAPTRSSNEKNRWSLQYYAAPSLSYRLLHQDADYNKSLISSGLIAANSFNQVGDAVSHRRDIGIEAGAAIGYQVSEKLRIKAGLQLNYRAFNIDAFQLQSAQATTLRIRQGNEYDSVFAIANMGNFAGNTAVQLTNRFLQISVPIGFELSMATWGNTGFFVGTTLQPTYNLQQHAWQLSANYQYYVQQPSLLRSFNMNTAVEAFFRFRTKGGLHWQMGPQIRYQLMPTTQKVYPVREQLIDFGLKIGVTKTL